MGDRAAVVQRPNQSPVLVLALPCRVTEAGPPPSLGPVCLQTTLLLAVRQTVAGVNLFPALRSGLWTEMKKKSYSRTSRILEKMVLGALSGPDVPKAAKGSLKSNQPHKLI